MIVPLGRSRMDIRCMIAHSCLPVIGVVSVVSSGWGCLVLVGWVRSIMSRPERVDCEAFLFCLIVKKSMMCDMIFSLVSMLG